MTGYRTEIVTIMFTVAITAMIFTGHIAGELGLGLIATQLAPYLAAKRASRNAQRMDDIGLPG